MSNYDNKKDVRYTVFVTSKMDDDLSQVSELMGMSKSEMIRYFIGQGMLGYKTSIDILRSKADEMMEKKQIEAN